MEMAEFKGGGKLNEYRREEEREERREGVSHNSPAMIAALLDGWPAPVLGVMEGGVEEGVASGGRGSTMTEPRCPGEEATEPSLSMSNTVTSYIPSGNPSRS